MALQTNLRNARGKKFGLGGWLIALSILFLGIFLFAAFSGDKKKKTSDEDGSSEAKTSFSISYEPKQDGPYIITMDTTTFALQNVTAVQDGRLVDWKWSGDVSIGLKDMNGNVYALKDGKNVKFAPDIKDFAQFDAWIIPGSKKKKASLTLIEMFDSKK